MGSCYSNVLPGCKRSLWEEMRGITPLRAGSSLGPSLQMAKSNRLRAGTPIPGLQTPYKDPVSVPKVKASGRNTLPFFNAIGSMSSISYLTKGQLGVQEEA